MKEAFGAFARSINNFSASPQATGAAFAIVAIWVLLGPHFHFSTEWQLIIDTGATVVTFLMVFVLNHAQSRDTFAINAKLDAVIFALDSADNRLIGLERCSDSEATAVHQELAAAIEADASDAERPREETPSGRPA